MSGRDQTIAAAWDRDGGLGGDHRICQPDADQSEDASDSHACDDLTGKEPGQPPGVPAVQIETQGDDTFLLGFHDRIEVSGGLHHGRGGGRYEYFLDCYDTGPRGVGETSEAALEELVRQVTSALADPQAAFLEYAQRAQAKLGDDAISDLARACLWQDESAYLFAARLLEAKAPTDPWRRWAVTLDHQIAEDEPWPPDGELRQRLEDELVAGRLDLAAAQQRIADLEAERDQERERAAMFKRRSERLQALRIKEKEVVVPGYYRKPKPSARGVNVNVNTKVRFKLGPGLHMGTDAVTETSAGLNTIEIVITETP